MTPRPLPIAAAVLAAGLTPAAADPITWEMRGAVTAVGGPGFVPSDVAVGDTVAFRMQYDSAAEVRMLSFLPVGNIVNGRARFHGALRLSIEVQIGSDTWRGVLLVAGPDVAALETDCFDFGGNPDRLTARLRSGDGALFTSFPHAGGATTRSLEVDIVDATSPALLFMVHVLPDPLTDPSHITSATGAIRAGDNDVIQFELDPTKTRVHGPEVPVEISRTATGIRLEWESEEGKFYRIDESGDLCRWSLLRVLTGTGERMSTDIEPFGEHPVHRAYRISEE